MARLSCHSHLHGVAHLNGRLADDQRPADGGMVAFIVGGDGQQDQLITAQLTETGAGQDGTGGMRRMPDW
jgi:hypothetical protein